MIFSVYLKKVHYVFRYFHRREHRCKVQRAQSFVCFTIVLLHVSI